MDDAMVAKAKLYLREKLGHHQAVIMVTHWNEEIPWPPSVVRQLQLKDGTCIHSEA
jgi:ABC-type molybdenum transport system ATPase subunit/photorepair protein PhrA